MRQLATYALLWEKEKLEGVLHLAILYLRSNAANVRVQEFQTWNGADLSLWPVRVKGARSLAEAILV